MTREPGTLMAKTSLVVEHHEHLWSLLVEAAQIEHMIMCQYLYACFSLKTEPDEGLTAEQALVNAGLFSQAKARELTAQPDTGSCQVMTDLVVERARAARAAEREEWP